MTVNNLYYAIIQVNSGWIGVLGSEQGLLRLTFPQPSQSSAELLLGPQIKQAQLSPLFFKGLIEELQAYFQGVPVDFTDTIDLSQSTPFEKSVWTACRSIPYGETRSYHWIAGQIDKPLAARAVGQALGRNPVPIIIPCHRVLAGTGQLGGFGGGLDMKQYLLKLESITLR